MLSFLGVTGGNPTEADVFRTFSDRLRNESRNWLLIIDSADSEDILLHVPAGDHTEGQDERCIDYLRPCNHGSVLLTTRTKHVALKVVDYRDIVTVKPMERKHALALLEKKLGQEYTLEEVSRLAIELDFIPLAMVQAASFMIRRTPRCSVAAYIAELWSIPGKRKRKRGEEDLRRDREAANTVFSTWHISFKHVLKARKSAIHLLSLMSCFDRQAIPETLLGGYREHGDLADNMRGYSQKKRNNTSNIDDGDTNMGESASDGSGDYDSSSTSGSDKFEDDILMLRDYSFISVTTNPSIFEMHRLVQIATQRWLNTGKLLEHWRSHFITNLDRAFPIGKFENWTKCRELYPHATLGINTELSDRDALLRQASLLENSGWYALEQGDYGVSEQMRSIAKKSREQVLGPDDPLTVVSMHNLALTYLRQGRYKLAMELGEQVVEKRERAPGPEHLDTLTSVSVLAAAYCSLGRLARGAELQKQVLDTRERVLGPRNLETLNSMNNLSTTYQQLASYDLAEELGERALKTRQSELEPEHPDIAMSMSNLAITYQHQGRYKEAEELGKRALEMKKKVLRAEHPQTAASMSNLATTYRSLELYDQAIVLEEQALGMRKRGLGLHHPDTLICMSNLAKNYRLQKRYEEAADLGEQILQIRKKLFPPDHPSVATSMGNLAATYRSMKRHSQAIELGREALEIRKKVLKPDHPHIATNMHSLALSMSSCQNKDLLKEAAELHDQALRIRQRVLRPAHPDILISRGDLANSLRALNFDEEAVEKAIRLASLPGV
jgi:tetratricopeptide (TPR) repeat protein